MYRRRSRGGLKREKNVNHVESEVGASAEDRNMELGNVKRMTVWLSADVTQIEPSQRKLSLDGGNIRYSPNK